ncbi:protein ENHANCED DOWNY MILDEW 2-like [Tasmannia lanceolata]|uniref:protein ENHANCED DOWNY MILDEW 2-like n=1 Tax=Tasmannia lanceolata TaxID=3420 RepID=UPI004062E963
MASSDDEGDAIPQSITNYHFVDDKDEPITFSVLPIQLDGDEGTDAMKKQAFLHGTADTGLKIYKQVTAWKLELSNEQPEVSVLCKENTWIKLQKPRKSYEDIIRTISITVQCLHFALNSPEASEKSLWDHLRKVFSLFEIRPSENDLLDHVPLITGMVKRDENLAKSKFLLTFLEEMPKKRKVYVQDMQTDQDAKKPKFIVDDGEYMDEDVGDADLDESDEEPDLFDSVCAICDNGGDLLCCEGKCLRSFHATKDAGADSECASLGLSKAQVKAIQNFYCANCQYKQHQCFACGELGSSDKSFGAEVFPCVSATCGYFFHPECVAKLLHPGNEDQAEEQQKKIAAGESFTCPVHKCLVCKQGENKEVEELQFAICRRCPRAYHRKCLPREIPFEDDSEDEDIIQRAWDDLIPNRILIYCLDHEIDEDIGTPIRNHIRFPGIAEKKKVRPLDSQSSKGKVLLKKKSVISEDSSKQRAATKPSKRLEKVASDVMGSDPTKRTGKPLSGQGIEPSKKSKTPDAFKKKLKGSVKGNNTSVREERSASLKGLEIVKSKDLHDSKLGKMLSPSSVLKKSSASPHLVDSETEKKIMDLMRTSSSSLNLEDVMKRHRMPTTHGSSRNIDKAITLGKVEGSVEAVRTALQKLEEGNSIEDARAVCEPMILNQLIKWKNKLKVYLSPFIHGMRYTSFGRHFTKVDKLKEIVDRLHWYAQNDDMIVDFCCGANDFSRIMKEKLDETGKKCFFKNYDLIQPKFDFNFEKRDWMTVRPTELPTGSQLIMGLNPPFGVKASLANKFIDKALEFKPKLLILIVPQETERLDEKKATYDLIWEDGKKLAGKSFYLPGSVDVDDKQIEQWNNKPPFLYLWSRSDWTSRHKAIAIQRGHMSEVQEESGYDANKNETRVSDQHEEYGDLNDQMSNVLYDVSKQNDQVKELEEPRSLVPEQKKEILPPKQDSRLGRSTHEEDGDRDAHENHENRKKRARESPKEREHKAKQSRLRTATPEDKQDNVRSQEKQISRRTATLDDKQDNVRSQEKGTRRRTATPEDKQDNVSSQEKQISRRTATPDDKQDNVRSQEKGTRRRTATPEDKQDSVSSQQKQKRHRTVTPEDKHDNVRSQEKGTPLRMSSSPNRTVPRSLLGVSSEPFTHPSEPFIHPSERVSSENSFHHFRLGTSGSGSEFGSGYGGSLTSIADGDLDDITRRYTLNKDNLFPIGAQRWSTSSNIVPDYGVPRVQEQFPGYIKDSNVGNSYAQRPYLDDLENFGQREADIRLQLRLYGQQSSDDLLQRNPYQLGQDSGLGKRASSLSSPFGLSVSAAESSRLNSSAMQRYAPRLDEMNYVRPSPFASDMSSMTGRNSMPEMSSLTGRSSVFNAPGAPPTYNADTLGFAPGPQRPPYPYNNPSGWLN